MIANTFQNVFLLQNIQGDMDKITITEVGRAFFDLDHTNKMNNSHLPSINIHQQQAPHEEDNKTKHRVSKSKFDIFGLRSILRDNTLSQLNKLKEQTQQKAYKYVKQQLIKDIAQTKQFIDSKADAMARKMLIQDKLGSNIHTELGKGKNYLSKLVGDYQVRKEEDERLRSRLKQKVRMIV